MFHVHTSAATAPFSFLQPRLFSPRGAGVRAIGLKFGESIRAQEPGVEELQAPTDAENRVTDRRGRKSNDRRPTALPRPVGQDQFHVAKQQRMGLAPPTDAVPRIGSERNAHLLCGGNGKDGVVGTGVEESAVKMD
jgi:hypothetical protein